MPTFNLAEIPTLANELTTSPSATMPSQIVAAVVTLASSDWTNPALAGRRVLWGIQLSTNNGASWGPGTCDSPSTNLIGGASAAVPSWAYQTDVVGVFGRNGNMPTFAFSGGDMPPAGALVRLFAWPEVAIHLGVTLTVN